MTEQNTAPEEQGSETNNATNTETKEPATREEEGETNIPTRNENDSTQNTGKDNKDHIIARQADKIAKFEATQKKGDDNAKTSSGGEDFMKAVEEKYGKQLSSVRDMQTDIEVKNFLDKEENAMFREFAGDIAKFAKHPSRANLPIQSIAYEVAGPTLMKKGADMARESATQATQSQTGGGSKAQPIVSKKVADMTAEEMEQSVSNLIFAK